MGPKPSEIMLTTDKGDENSSTCEALKLKRPCPFLTGSLWQEWELSTDLPSFNLEF